MLEPTNYETDYNHNHLSCTLQCLQCKDDSHVLLNLVQ